MSVMGNLLSSYPGELWNFHWSDINTKGAGLHGI